MSFAVQTRDLTLRYGSTVAVDRVSLEIPPGTICGLLGRNGSGKTTLLSAMAAFRRPNAGTLLVDGEDPWENARVLEGVVLVRESGDVLSDRSLEDNLALVAQSRPHYSHELAGTLMDRFELDPRSKHSALSRGRRSAFGTIVGLASRAPLTLLDEVHLGMDAPSRYEFYDALLADYVSHPRTIVLSSHLIEEVQRLLETVVVLHHGKVLLTEDAETLRRRGVCVTGPDQAVEAFVAGRTVVGRQSLGPTTQATVYGDLEPEEIAAARGLGLEIGPVDLQDLFVHLTGKEAGR
ncbi:ATP-binding cassette domain-containing protein [Actinotalea sp. K2]|uniref:ATP-binding cassette domain-containing protein n=1 Tax=Actinotalea sp. K2 TaxID=2939438 RepID=UPI00201732BA|nr:ABC transporter ATP-binding protein [Actinotalea sp. K2]MCL3859577.1 ABC transporter ATP-binding protein [Actinotalea sp. K2]